MRPFFIANALVIAHAVPHDPTRPHEGAHPTQSQPQPQMHVQTQALPSHASHHGWHHAPVPSPGLPPPSASPPAPNATASAESYAYDDDDDDDDDGSTTNDDEVETKEDMENDLWKELDIDEDRDEPILKVTVVLFTVGVFVVGVRHHCCQRYKAVPSDSAAARRAEVERELAFAPDFQLPGRPARFSRRSSAGDDEGWSLDIFATIARKLQL